MIDNKFYIDSFRLVCPSENFIKINIPKLYLFSEYSELIHEFKQKALPVEYNQTTIYINRVRTQLKDNHLDYIIILFSSKASKDYFKGIQIDTIINVYEYLRELNIIDYESLDSVLINTKARDTDIKQDYTFKNENYNKQFLHDEFKRRIESYIHSDNIIGRGCQIINKKDNFGLQVNHRGSATIKAPYFKIYWKNGELRKKDNIILYNQFPFKLKKYLENNQIFRFEFTINKDDHFKKFDVSNNIYDLLDLVNDFDKINEIKQYFVLANFFENTIEVTRNYGILSPTDQIIMNAIIMLNKTGMAYGNISHNILATFSCPVTKSRQKKRIENLISLVINNFKQTDKVTKTKIYYMQESLQYFDMLTKNSDYETIF